MNKKETQEALIKLIEDSPTLKGKNWYARKLAQVSFLPDGNVYLIDSKGYVWRRLYDDEEG